jgi:predicted RNA-binding Zn-ribbon protein involved in translation (DUF1610 family)
MSSKRSHEGYFATDHRGSPGVPDEIVVAQGLQPGAGKGLFESATFTCSHCEAVVIKNPDRSRERAWCKKCDHYICDNCGMALHQTGVCYPFKAMVNDILNLQAKAPAQSEVSASALLTPEIDQALSRIIIP